MVVYDTQFEDSSNNIKNYLSNIEKAKESQPTKLPTNAKYNKKREEILENPFLDISLRQFIDDFVLTWHKIILDLLETDRYTNFKKNNLWNKKLMYLIKIFIDVFWVADRIFYVGIGFCILSFFVFFITLTN